MSTFLKICLKVWSQKEPYILELCNHNCKYTKTETLSKNKKKKNPVQSSSTGIIGVNVSDKYTHINIDLALFLLLFDLFHTLVLYLFAVNM